MLTSQCGTQFSSFHLVFFAGLGFERTHEKFVPVSSNWTEQLMIKLRTLMQQQQTRSSPGSQRRSWRSGTCINSALPAAQQRRRLVWKTGDNIGNCRSQKLFTTRMLSRRILMIKCSKKYQNLSFYCTVTKVRIILKIADACFQGQNRTKVVTKYEQRGEMGH